MSRNKLTSVDLHTFSSNRELDWLDLQINTITDIHPSTFRNNIEMEYLDLSTNLLSLVHSNTFQYNVNLKSLSLTNNNILDIIKTGFLSRTNPTYLDLSRNSIRYLDNSVFRKQGQIETLILSKNLLQSLESGIFSDCKNLRNLYRSENIISEISRSAFYGLDQLEHLDLSNNNIEELDPLVFQAFSISTNRQYLQVSKLKHLNLAQNKIQFFNFELYFPMSNNFYTSNPMFLLDYLNVSSNRLTTLDVASMKWLNHTTTLTDLTANPWNCDCSVLLEVWRGLKNKLTLHCASPTQLRGKLWDEMEILCSLEGGPSLVTTNFIVTDVLLVCAIGGGIILVTLVKRRRNKPKTLEYCDVYAPRASYISMHSYAEVGARPSYVSVQS